MPCHGVRGATTVETNSREEILAATRELLVLMIRRNGIQPEDVASAIFTTTRELNAEFPALAARQLGWLEVPLLCGNEMEVTGALPQCIRILIHWNTTKSQREIQHVYVRGAESLRPDMQQLPAVDINALEAEIARQQRDAEIRAPQPKS